MAQFWLKIAHLSFSIATTPLLKMVSSYGLRPRLWLLLKYNTTPLRGLWERECNRDSPSRVFALFTSVTCICVELGLVHGVVCVRYDWSERSFWFWFDGIKPLISDIKTATNPIVCNFWFYMHMRVNSISVSYIHEINYLAEPRYNDLG